MECPSILKFILDLGTSTFQVGTIRRVGAGNPIEAILNSQSKRQSPTIIAYDGEQFHVGEHAVAFSKKNQKPLFTNFATRLSENISQLVHDSSAPEINDIKDYQGVLLLQALINHVAANMINHTDVRIDITLVHPPSWSLEQLRAVKLAVDAIPNITLTQMIPTPAAVVVSHAAGRIKELKKKEHQYVVIDVGASATEISVVQTTYLNDSDDTQVSVIFNSEQQFGGDAITNCLSKQLVIDKLPNYSKSNIKLSQRVFEAVERAKIALTGKLSSKVTIEAGISPTQDLTVHVERSDVDRCVTQLMDVQTVQRIKTQLDPLAETQYLFYGGSSRVPKVQQMFETAFKTQIMKTVNLDEGAIYGGGLVTARNVAGMKVGARFVVRDATRPNLEYITDSQEPEFVMQLNPLKTGLATVRMPHINNSQWALAEKTIGVQVIEQKGNESIYNTVEVKYKEIDQNSSLAKFQFKASQNDADIIDIQCEISLNQMNQQQFLQKYEKKNGQSGLSGVSSKKFEKLKADLEQYQKDQTEIIKILQNQSAHDVKLALNVSTDASSIPEVQYIAIQITDDIKLKKKQPFINEHPVQFKCQTSFAETLIPAYMYDEAYNIIWDSNVIQRKRSAFESKMNKAEILFSDAAKFIDSLNVSNETSGNYAIYADEGDRLVISLQDAQYITQNPKFSICPTAACIDARLSDLDDIVKPIHKQIENITKRLENIKCRQSAVKKLKESVESLDETAKDARMKQDKLKPHADCKYLEDNATANTTFTQLIQNYETLNNLTHMETVFTPSDAEKSVQELIKNCSNQKKAVETLSKKLDEYFAKNGSKTQFDLFRRKIDLEQTQRPTTECETVKNTTKDMDKMASELRKLINTKISNESAVKNLYLSSQKGQDSLQIISELRQLVKDNNMVEIREKLAKEFKMNVSQDQVSELIKDSFEKKLDNVTDMEIWSEEIKKKLKRIQEDLKEEL